MSQCDTQRVSNTLHELTMLNFVTTQQTKAVEQLKQLTCDPAIDNRLIAISELKNVDERDRTITSLRKKLIDCILTHHYSIVPGNLVPWALSSSDHIDYLSAVKELEKLDNNDQNDGLKRALALNRALRLLINESWLQDSK
jgi:hypothetical protein